MTALIRPFFEIIFLRQGPQDLPASRALLALCLLLYILLGIVIASPFYGLQQAIVQSVLEVSLLALLVWLLLRLRGMAARFTQTLTAFSGAGVLLGLLTLPLVYSLLGAEARSTEQIPALASLTYLLILGWLLGVYGHILRHAMNFQGLAPGVALAIVLIILSAAASELVIIGMAR
ncbi:hypothetical protein [Thiorhodospira sibirica]|uniref:hypothetical protein n=1 Tax=Thiorhodospira sibirica TaxID=154347 RepID=UPI00022C4695|nr:hypothetical protein [Thiorhodospira sibirica]